MKKKLLNTYLEHSENYIILNLMLGVMEFLNNPLKLIFMIIPVGTYAIALHYKEYLELPFIPDEIIPEYNIFLTVLLLTMFVFLTLAVIETVGRTLHNKETAIFREAFEGTNENKEKIHLLYKRKKGDGIERRIYSHTIQDEWNNKNVYLKILKIFDEHFKVDKFVMDMNNSRITIMKTEKGFIKPIKENYHDENLDKELEENMEELLDIVVLGRACRNTANIKNRQPIGTMFVKAEKAMDSFYTDIIADELNVKEVKFADDVESFISYSFKPQLRTVGPKYGKLLNGIRQALNEIDGTKAMNELRANGVLVLDIDGNKVELTEEDLLIETAQTEGYVTETDGTTSVVLDTNLTPELIEEGFVREIISKVQTMRKEAGFEVMDKICIYAKDNEKIEGIMKAHEEEIKGEVLAENIVFGETDGYVKDWNINKEQVTLAVTRL